MAVTSGDQSVKKSLKNKHLAMQKKHSRKPQKIIDSQNLHNYETRHR
jgi:hypothetical protein